MSRQQAFQARRSKPMGGSPHLLHGDRSHAPQHSSSPSARERWPSPTCRHGRDGGRHSTHDPGLPPQAPPSTPVVPRWTPTSASSSTRLPHIRKYVPAIVFVGHCARRRRSCERVQRSPMRSRAPRWSIARAIAGGMRAFRAAGYPLRSPAVLRRRAGFGESQGFCALRYCAYPIEAGGVAGAVSGGCSIQFRPGTRSLWGSEVDSQLRAKRDGSSSRGDACCGAEAGRFRPSSGCCDRARREGRSIGQSCAQRMGLVIGTAVPVTEIPPSPGGMSTTIRLGRPMSCPWKMLIFTGGSTRLRARR